MLLHTSSQSLGRVQTQSVEGKVKWGNFGPLGISGHLPLAVLHTAKFLLVISCEILVIFSVLVEFIRISLN